MLSPTSLIWFHLDLKKSTAFWLTVETLICIFCPECITSGYGCPVLSFISTARPSFPAPAFYLWNFPALSRQETLSCSSKGRSVITIHTNNKGSDQSEVLVINAAPDFSLPAASLRDTDSDRSQSFVSITDNKVPRSAVLRWSDQPSSADCSFSVHHRCG